MKRIIFAFLLVAALASSAAAGTIGPYDYTRVTNYYDGSGGEFSYKAAALDNSAYAATTSNIGWTGAFQTFCLETSEWAADGYFNLSYAAIMGGTGSADPISKGTAWLYNEFVNGTLSLYNYTPGSGRNASALALQNAIWYFEGEGGSANAFTALAISALGASVAAENANGYLGVYVLNNYKDEAGTVLAQDFLYKSVPDGGATLMLLGGALMGLGVLRRKFRS